MCIRDRVQIASHMVIKLRHPQLMGNQNQRAVTDDIISPSAALSICLLYTSVEGDALLMECVEGETVNRIPIGIGLPHYGDCSIKRDIYTVGSQVWKTIDEDENPVLIFTISFIEMSNTRIIKLFLEPDPIHVEMDEEPSMTEALRNLSMGMLESMKEKIPFKKNQEYLLYRIERLMAPRAEASWKE